MTCTFITFDSSHIMLNFLLTSKKLEKAWSILMPSPGDLQAVERNSVWLYLTHGMIDFTVHQSKLFFLFKICKYILQQLMPFWKNKTLQTSVCFYECQHILSRWWANKFKILALNISMARSECSLVWSVCRNVRLVMHHFCCWIGDVAFLLHLYPVNACVGCVVRDSD